MFEMLNENPMDVTTVKRRKLSILGYYENTESWQGKPCYNNNTCNCDLYIQKNALSPTSGKRTIDDGVTKL